MTETALQVCMLRSRRSRRRGAMFCPELAGRVMVFVYERPARRLFHTFFCPPLRILALTDSGVPLLDVVRPKNRWVQLPPTRLVVECSPDHALTDAALRLITELARFDEQEGSLWTV